MFGSIGQPVSGVKSDRTARIFLKQQEDEAARREENRRRGRRRRQRIFRMIKGWFVRDHS